MYRTHILRRVREQRVLHSVTIELTYRCNLDCFFCYNDRDKAGTPLSLKDYEVLLTDLARMQTLFVMLTGGEPMIHPLFFDIARLTRELGFVVSVRTNGHNLGQRNVLRLRDEVNPYIVEVSMHGATASVHDRQTRIQGSFERLLMNLKIAKTANLRCGVVVTPTVWNEHQIDEMFVLCDSMDIPLRFQGPVAPRDNGDIDTLALQPAERTWQKIEEMVTSRHRAGSSGCLQATERPIHHGAREKEAMCSVGVAGVDIDPYGNVLACMHLQKRAGNIHEKPIDEIWHHSPLFQRARNRAISAAEQFTDKAPRQFGAPLYCIAVEENVGTSTNPKGIAGSLRRGGRNQTPMKGSKGCAGKADQRAKTEGQ